MKKINYVYYIFLFVLVCAILKYSNYIEDKIGINGYFCLEMLYVLWLTFFLSIVYFMVRKKGVRDDFCIAHQCKFKWSTFWVDTIHNELACLCMFNPFKIQYVSMNRVHDADIKIRYFSAEQYIAYFNIRFYIDGKRKTFRVKQHRYGWENTKANEEALTEDARKLVEIINKKPSQM